MDGTSASDTSSKTAIPVLAAEFLIFAVFVAIAGYFFLLRGNTSSSSQNVTVQVNTASSESITLTPSPIAGSSGLLTQTYENPFDTYTNPFDSTQNPFDNLQ